MTNSFDTISQAQRERMSYIDFRLDFFGEINRGDLVSRFGIKDAAATRDITLYRKVGFDNIEYDNQARIYLRRDSYTPLFPRTHQQTFTAIASGLGDNYIGSDNTVIPCESPVELISPNLEVLSAVTRAIHQKRPISINYLSLSSGESYREIVPHAMVNNSLRWHVRAYDRKNSRFADFVINRITTVDRSDTSVDLQELPEHDLDWNTQVALKLVPHPQIKHIESIKNEYGMTDDGITVTVRSALAGYTLRRWNVDCSTDHHLTGGEYHLWLENTAEIAEKASLTVAPK